VDGAEAGREALGILAAIVDEEVERHAAVGTEAQVTMLIFEVVEAREREGSYMNGRIHPLNLKPTHND